MKQCTKCKQFKDLSEFTKHARSKDGRHSHCRECTRSSNNLAYKVDTRRKISNKTARDVTYARQREFITEYKEQRGCCLCNENTPCVLDLHHTDPSTKNNHVSNMIGGSQSKLEKELTKCVVLCANCHRKIHAGLIKLGT